MLNFIRTSGINIHAVKKVWNGISGFAHSNMDNPRQKTPKLNACRMRGHCNSTEGKSMFYSSLLIALV